MSKKTNTPSESLEKVIKLVNSIPWDVELPDISKLLVDIKTEKMKLSIATTPNFDETIRRINKDIINHAVQDLKNQSDPMGFEDLAIFLHLNTQDHDSRFVDSFVKKYQEFKYYRNFFQELLRIREAHEAVFVPSDEFSYFSMGESDLYLFAYGENGEIKFRPPTIFQIVEGHDLVRFKVCEVCKKVFYAKKTNALTCGKAKCASTLFNRKRLERAKQEKRGKK